ncbi:MAG: NYN domain-containing protein [Candidatus Eiseniibacteriota bacterium]|jgi:uncharacterized protein (TIGR00288 family)
MPIDEEVRIAVYIDVDNIRSSVESYLDTQLDFDAIMAKINSLGRVLLKRAYADWSMSENRVLRRVLQENGVEPVQVFVTHGMKNSADISLSIDCIDLIFTRDVINTIVLVSGDSDFVPLVQRLRAYGKQVIGIGVRRQGTSHVLVRTCDRFEFYENLVTRPSIGHDDDYREARELLIHAMRAMSPAGNWIKAAPLKALMQRQDPSFDEANLGYRQFKDFLRACGRAVEISEQPGSDILVRIAAEEGNGDHGPERTKEEIAEYYRRLLTSRHRVRSIPSPQERHRVFDELLRVLAATRDVGSTISFLELRAQVRRLLDGRMEEESIDNLLYTLFYMYAFQFDDLPEVGTQERPARLADRIEPTPDGIERYYRRTIVRWLIKDGATIKGPAVAAILGVEDDETALQELESLGAGSD